MKKIDYDFCMKLKNEPIPLSKIPKAIQRAAYYQNLVNAKVILLPEKGRGRIRINEDKRIVFERFLATNFKNEVQDFPTRVSNISTFRNSKSRKTNSNFITFLRGFEPVLINEKEVDLAYYTTQFGLFSTQLESLKCEKICFIENLPCFLKAEQLIKGNYTFIHAYGRIGATLLQKMNAQEILVFSDFDFIGLNEYLNIKAHFPTATFYLPSNFDELFENYSRPLKENNKEYGQRPSKKVQSSEDKTIIKVREMVYKSQRFLEQEILLDISEKTNN